MDSSLVTFSLFVVDTEFKCPCTQGYKYGAVLEDDFIIMWPSLLGALLTQLIMTVLLIPFKGTRLCFSFKPQFDYIGMNGRNDHTMMKVYTVVLPSYEVCGEIIVDHGGSYKTTRLH